MTKLRIDFINNMRLASLAQNTIKCYVNNLRVLAKYCNKSPDKISDVEIRDFMIHLKDSGRSDKLIHSYFYAFKKFYKFMEMEDKMKLLPTPRRTYKIPIILNKMEIIELVSSCDGVLEKLFVSLLYSSGMRIGELINLKISDIDIERKTIYISKSKTGRQRYVILSDNVIDILKYYIMVFKPIDYLFYRSKSKHLPADMRRLQIIFQRIVKRSKIRKRVTAHTLRHSFATHLLESGCNIFHIQRLLGHSSLSSTLLYLHLDNSIHLKVISPFESVNSEVLNPIQFLKQRSLNLKCA